MGGPSLTGIWGRKAGSLQSFPRCSVALAAAYVVWNDRRVRGISFCGDTYRVAVQNGSTRTFWERNPRFKTDQGARGPRLGAPVIMPTGMLGDRATVIFSRPEEIDSTIKRAC